MEDNSEQMDLAAPPPQTYEVEEEGDNAQYNHTTAFENDDNKESGGAHTTTAGENTNAAVADATPLVGEGLSNINTTTTHNDNSESCAAVVEDDDNGDENENEDDAVAVNGGVAAFSTAGANNNNNGNTESNTLLTNPTFESPVHPIAISQVDKIIKQSLTDLASVSLAIANAKANAKTKSSSGSTETSTDHTFNIAKDAKLAIHKSANVFVLMLAAMVENNRKEALVSASEAHQRAVKQGGPRSRAAQQAASALAAAEKKYKGIISGKEIEAALESAGYKHLVPMMTKRPRDDN